MGHWLLHLWYMLSGADNEAGPTYGTWSGIAGATACFAWFPAGMLLYRHHNCHEPWCPRIGRHTVGGTPFRACRRHHPELASQPKPKRGHMTEAWDRARAR